MPILFASIFLIAILWISSCGSNLASDVAVGTAKNAKYVTNISNFSKVLLCGANSQSGLFTSCVSTATNYNFNSPWGITLTNVNGKNTAYIADTGNNAVVKCDVNPDNSLSGCGSASSFAFKAPISTAVYAGSNVNYIYVANSGSGFANVVVKCIIQSDGSFSSCNTTGSSLGADQIGVTILGNFFYAASSSSRTLAKCNIDPVAGTLSSCSTTGSGFVVPISITANAISTGSFVYVSDSSVNLVLVCPVNTSTGVVGACAPTGSPTNSAFGQPTGVSITGNLAYISDYGTNTIFLCSINSDGTLSSSCVSTGTGYTGPVASF